MKEWRVESERGNRSIKANTLVIQEDGRLDFFLEPNGGPIASYAKGAWLSYWETPHPAEKIRCGDVVYRRSDGFTVVARGADGLVQLQPRAGDGEIIDAHVSDLFIRT